MKTGKTQPHRVSFYTVGCRLNQSETATLTDRFQSAGYEPVEFGTPTDLLVLNTCSVTEGAEADCRNIIRRTLRQSPQAFVAVTGCYAQTGAEALRNIPGIDLILGANFKMNVTEYLQAFPGLVKRPEPEVLHSRKIDRDDFVLEGTGDYQTTRANLKIQDGCNFMCSFCIIPFARGHERSRRLEDAAQEAEALVQRGHRELVLTGVNIGLYAERDATLLDLIQWLEAIPGLERIRISSIEPTTIPDQLIDYMVTSTKLCRFLHVPLQSGDDDILRAMNRRYTVQEYRTFIETAVQRIPDLCVGTDLMVGFPGESEQQFANTQAVVEDLPFAYCHVFSFSKRPGTAATKMSNTVPARTIKARSRALAECSRRKRLAFYQRYTGRIVSVLFENRDAQGLWTGLTDNYIRVGVSASGDLTNQMQDVMVTGVMDGLAIGHLADETTSTNVLTTIASQPLEMRSSQDDCDQKTSSIAVL